jgi:hypothetical protein
MTMIDSTRTWTLNGPTNPVHDAVAQSWRSFLLGLASGALLTLLLLLAAGSLPGTARLSTGEVPSLPTGPVGDPPKPTRPVPPDAPAEGVELPRS